MMASRRGSLGYGAHPEVRPYRWSGAEIAHGSGLCRTRNWRQIFHIALGAELCVGLVVDRNVAAEWRFDAPYLKAYTWERLQKIVV
jgi:hypothetical protein